MFGHPNKEINMYELISVIHTKGKFIKMSCKPDELNQIVCDNKYSKESILRYAEVYEYTAYEGDDSILLINFYRWDIKLRIYNKIKG